MERLIIKRKSRLITTPLKKMKRPFCPECNLLMNPSNLVHNTFVCRYCNIIQKPKDL